MSLGLAFWIIMPIWLVLGAMWRWPRQPGPLVTFAPFFCDVVLFMLLLLLGWKVFGPPLHG